MIDDMSTCEGTLAFNIVKWRKLIQDDTKFLDTLCRQFFDEDSLGAVLQCTRYCHLKEVFDKMCLQIEYLKEPFLLRECNLNNIDEHMKQKVSNYETGLYIEMSMLNDYQEQVIDFHNYPQVRKMINWAMLSQYLEIPTLDTSENLY